ncbi:MAG: hypothetical protein UR52_C0003G0010 [Candidatus Gottesmanbacteria bacterium GW2011_GWA1_34_13]|uniref:Uncharacterized protein n=1 Tax=Candidatus Gottesmanbacteria bacterium GW2011_GWA1_34_13 TaxID=1618434 RepID=A0A0G0ARX2_9BACT|nr:MAG: hypothetical protein UR52_C0003G0010 [Candidatus Gottesmanbacteria bacterium GW2011_GWA1_34_13]
MPEACFSQTEYFKQVYSSLYSQVENSGSLSLDIQNCPLQPAILQLVDNLPELVDVFGVALKIADGDGFGVEETTG